MTQWIDENFYKEILNAVPIVCVDLILIRENKFLLGQRLNEPAKSQWFFAGGRVFKNEPLKDAALRKAKEELGVEITYSDLKLLGVGETIFQESNRHTVNTVFTVNFNNTLAINFDKTQHSKIEWFSSIDENWHPYVKEMLELAGFGKIN
ncbi:MAG: NUDIX domain-containing protein [Patescibacteria group bacterium]